MHVYTGAHAWRGALLAAADDRFALLTTVRSAIRRWQPEPEGAVALTGIGPCLLPSPGWCHLLGAGLRAGLCTLPRAPPPCAVAGIDGI